MIFGFFSLAVALRFLGGATFGIHEVDTRASSISYMMLHCLVTLPEIIMATWITPLEPMKHPTSGLQRP